MKFGYHPLDRKSAKSAADRFGNEQTRAFIDRIKELPEEDTGSFRVIMSTSDQDRQGESVDQDGLDFSNYLNNPVVLWAHDYETLPIGICTGISKQGNQTIAEGRFAPADANPFAQQVRRLYELGYQRAVSVGFIPKEVDENGNTTNGEVLEFSFVPIPANPYALTLNMIKSSSLDLEMLTAKGISFSVSEEKPLTSAAEKKAGTSEKGQHMAKKEESDEKAAQVGAACQLDDGTPGTLQKNPDDPDGPLVCMPDKNASKSDKPEDGHADDGEAGSHGDEPSNQTAEAFMRNYLEGEHPTHAKAIKEAIDEYRGSMKEAMDGSYDKEEMTTKCKEAMKGVKAKCKEEAGRHLVTVQKMIDEFTGKTGKKASREPSEHDDEETEEDDHDSGALAGELRSGMKEEFEDHHSYIGKAIEEFHEKAIDEGETSGSHSTALAKSIRGEHDRHKEAIKEAIQEFKEGADHESGDEEGGNPTNNGKKGQVSDVVNEEDVMNQKWSKLDKVFKIFDAFISSYMDEKTPVEDFEKLLDETVALLKGGQAKSAFQKSLIELSEKAGAKLSKSTKEALMKAVGHLKDAMEAHEEAMDGTMETHKHLKNAHAALHELVHNPQDGGSEDEESPADEPGEKASKNEKVEPSGVKEPSDLDKSLADRELRNALKVAVTSASKVLEIQNQIIREKKLNRNWR